MKQKMSSGWGKGNRNFPSQRRKHRGETEGGTKVKEENEKCGHTVHCHKKRNARGDLIQKGGPIKVKRKTEPLPNGVSEGREGKKCKARKNM